MLCLRRISLDAKSRLLFLSRSHSSTNDSMPKSTAISRLIHKKFLQQNGNNSPQAIFVFLQQRGLRTKEHAFEQPVLEKKNKSAEDKEKEDRAARRFFSNLGTGAAVVFMMYTVRRVIDDSHSFTKMLELTYEKDNSDAKDSKDQFKFGFGPSGEKPKNEWEKYWYRRLERESVKKGESEEAFKKRLKKIDLDQISRIILFTFFTPGVFLALVTYILWTVFKPPSLRVFIVLMSVLPALSYLSIIRAYLRTAKGKLKRKR
ncbi:hypothetical protein Ddc_16368 [Ditylenchus destructor]|nr:hypothetical protein Ddc_16368 [Ditylenchus destructor]